MKINIRVVDCFAPFGAQVYTDMTQSEGKENCLRKIISLNINLII